MDVGIEPSDGNINNVAILTDVKSIKGTSESMTDGTRSSYEVYQVTFGSVGRPSSPTAMCLLLDSEQARKLTLGELYKIGLT